MPTIVSLGGSSPSSKNFGTFQISFSIETDQWNYTKNVYSYSINFNKVTKDMAVVEGNFYNNSDLFLSSDLFWNTSDGEIIFETNIIPKGKIEGYIILSGSAINSTTNYVSSINNTYPDANGNINVDLSSIKTINNHLPDNNGNLNLTPYMINALDRAPAFIEMFSATPFIDFHFNNSKQDYTSRIIEGEKSMLYINNEQGKGLNTNKILGNAIRYSTTAPSNPEYGQIWLKPKE